MQYDKLYYRFSESFKTQIIEKGVYTEKHHIIPRHAGGTDEDSNIVKVTYRQHIFLHRLRWKAFKDKWDYVAYKMMSGSTSEQRRSHYYYYGKLRAAEGWMDKIRPLANNEIQRAKARATGKRNVESGHLDRIRQLAYAARAESKRKRIKKKRDATEERYKDSPEKLSKFLDKRDMSMKDYQLKCELEASLIIQNALRDEAYLHMTSSQSKYLYISPENLKFETTKFAAGYYGNVSFTSIENWAKRSQYGWKRILKTDKE